MDGISLAIGGSTGAAIVAAAAKLWAARNQRTVVEPDPLHVEQSQQQALWKDNASDHANLFERMRKLEAEVSGHTQAILAMKDMQSHIYDMVTKLYEKICEGKRK